MCKFGRQPICSQRLKATCLMTVYGPRLACALKGERKQATSLLRQEQERAATQGKIGIFLRLRTCCSATKLLLMRAGERPRRGVPLRRLPKTTEQTEVFSQLMSRRERSGRPAPPPVSLRHGGTGDSGSRTLARGAASGRRWARRGGTRELQPEQEPSCPAHGSLEGE